MPSVENESLNVGFCDVLQQTPFAVTSLPPSDITLPPVFADVVAISVGSTVVTSGRSICLTVVKLICSPYEVPCSFVAYALT